MQEKEIPVLLLTGYLGSGKTTLVNRILKNKKGIRFAVIVNDIGEVNIDAELIQKQGVVGMNDNSLVSLQNGCICCTLQNDLIDQVFNLLKAQMFDYIVIEASGICDPSPIAQTICSIPGLGGAYIKYGICRLDSIVTIVDALRMLDEFGCGKKLTSNSLDEDDIENLLVQQIEFCNTVLLNKSSEVSSDQLNQIRLIIKALQPHAEIIECDYADVDLNRILHTRAFNFGNVATSAGWVKELQKDIYEIEDENNHMELRNNDGLEHQDLNEQTHHHGEHCHCHHHHNDKGEVEEYGISTFVYYRRPGFDMNKFDFFITSKWPQNVIRAKGICYFHDNRSMSYVFEQSGRQKQLSEVGRWYATLNEVELERALDREPGLKHDWDPVYGDRMQKIVFIGQHMDRDQIEHDLDFCLEDQMSDRE